MRKFSKRILKLALALAVVGLGLSIGGVAMDRHQSYEIWTEWKYQEIANSALQESHDSWDEDWDEITQLKPVTTEDDKEIFEIDPVSDLDFSLSGDALKLQSCDGDKIRVEVSGSKKDKVRIGTDDDSLVIESLGRTQEREITVSYPKNLRFKDTSIEVAAGTVTMCDDFRTDDLDVSVGAGEFTNTGKISVANDISVEVGTGNVEISELDIHDLEVDCGIGNVDLDILGKEADYNYEISCAAGNVDIGDSSYSGIGHDKNITNPNAKGDMELNCGVGNITVSFSK